VERNLEIKVRCAASELAAVRARALAAGASPFVTMRQVDTYFAANRGRLKLREIIDEQSVAQAELITYARPDELGSRWSDYERVPIAHDNVDGLKRALALACDLRHVVDKRRAVGLLGPWGIHLDDVSGLGFFVELETVIESGMSEAKAVAEHARVIAVLGLEGLEVVSGSYVDLMESSQRGVAQ
jgi:predicted adenylyl cyclase CyaB